MTASLSPVKLSLGLSFHRVEGKQCFDHVLARFLRIRKPGMPGTEPLEGSAVKTSSVVQRRNLRLMEAKARYQIDSALGRSYSVHLARLVKSRLKCICRGTLSSIFAGSADDALQVDGLWVSGVRDLQEHIDGMSSGGLGLYKLLLYEEFGLSVVYN